MSLDERVAWTRLDRMHELWVESHRGGDLDHAADLVEVSTGSSTGGGPPWRDRTISASAARSGYPIVILSRNRSSWASGRRYVPSISIGFCVAITMNGRGHRVAPRRRR